MKKTVTALSACLLVAVIFCICAFTITATTEKILFTMVQEKAEVGEEFLVELNVSSEVPVDSLLLYELSYDQDVLEFKGFTDAGELVTSNFLGDAGLDSSKGEITLAYTSPVTPNGKICALKFKVKDTAQKGIETPIAMTAYAAKDRAPVDGVKAPELNIKIESDFVFEASQLILDGELQYVLVGKIDDAIPADAYMEFKIGKQQRKVTVPLSDAKIDDTTAKFACPVNVLELNDPIDMQFHAGSKVIEGPTTTVCDYLKTLKAEYKDDTNVIRVANAVLNYGYYAQLTLDELHASYTVGKDGDYTPVDLTGVPELVMKSRNDFNLFKVCVSRKEKYMAVPEILMSLALDDQTSIHIYLSCIEDYVPEVTVKLKEDEVAFSMEKHADGRYKITIPNIAAGNLADSYSISVDQRSLVIDNLSALSYGYNIFSLSGRDNAKAAMSALLEYYEATVAYQSTQAK